VPRIWSETLNVHLLVLGPLPKWNIPPQTPIGKSLSPECKNPFRAKKWRKGKRSVNPLMKLGRPGFIRRKLWTL